MTCGVFELECRDSESVHTVSILTGSCSKLWVRLVAGWVVLDERFFFVAISRQRQVGFLGYVGVRVQHSREELES